MRGRGLFPIDAHCASQIDVNRRSRLVVLHDQCGGPGALRVDCQQPSSRAPSGTTSRVIDITLHHTLHHTIDKVDRVY